MTLKNQTLQILLFLLISTVAIGQKECKNPEEKGSNQHDEKTEDYNTWSLGVGISNLMLNGDIKSFGTASGDNYFNLGGYLYASKMYNPVVGFELKLDYSQLGGDIYSQPRGGYDIKGVNENLYPSELLILDGSRFGFELNGIINMTNLWRLDGGRWNTSFMAGLGYHYYSSKLTVDSTGDVIPETVYDNGASTFMNFAFSVKYKINQRFDFEFRPGFYLNVEDNLDAAISDKQSLETFLTGSVGVVYKLGKNKKHAIWVSENDLTDDKFEVVDSDGDGVMDYLDEEPDTPKGAEVYGNGRAIDTDKDGVPDYKDKCLLIPGLEANDGCPEDTDKDGVYDIDDLCPELKGVKENLGCPSERDYNYNENIDKKVFRFSKSIYFKKNSNQLKGASHNTLNEIANVMLQFPKTQYSIDGHTDDSGSADYNLKLSKQRAVGVKSYLEKIGINPERLHPEGYGEERPSADNNTNIGRDLNRRVEIHFVQPNSDQGKEIYKDLDGIYASVNVIEPNIVSIDPDVETRGQNKTTSSSSNQIDLTDSDGDGVPDQFDQHPNTPKGVFVYGNGVPIDSDKDGIPDYRDKCPLRAGTVKKKGCPDNKKGSKSNNVDLRDSDDDGVIDLLDKEPNTPKGARVYGNGVSLDSDYDDVPDHVDECPFKAGSIENKGCPTNDTSSTGNKLDSDGDGVIDELDKEPNTPRGAKVYSNGVAIDTDNDGTPDYKDKCPSVKGSTSNAGCPEKDSDKDGVSDANDLCPDIKGSLKNNGCPEKKMDKKASSTIDELAEKIKFERTKNTLIPETKTVLDQIVVILKNFPSTKYEIAAYTDNKQNEKYSLFLSKRRASAVKEYLIDEGINKKRLISEGYGNTQPKYPNDDSTKSQLNNRIEFYLMK